LQPAIVAIPLSTGCVTQDPNEPHHWVARDAPSMASNVPVGLGGVPSPCSNVPVMAHHSTWSLRDGRVQGSDPARDRSDFLAGDSLPLAVSCIRSSTIPEGSHRDEISRLISGIFSHHSAEYLAHMIASPAASRRLVISTTEARLCTPFAVGAGLRGPSALF